MNQRLRDEIQALGKMAAIVPHLVLTPNKSLERTRER
jgi:hypothetical protein